MHSKFNLNGTLEYGQRIAPIHQSAIQLLLVEMIYLSVEPPTCANLSSLPSNSPNTTHLHPWSPYCVGPKIHQLNTSSPSVSSPVRESFQHGDDPLLLPCTLAVVPPADRPIPFNPTSNLFHHPAMSLPTGIRCSNGCEPEVVHKKVAMSWNRRCDRLTGVNRRQLGSRHSCSSTGDGRIDGARGESERASSLCWENDNAKTAMVVDC